MKILAADPAKNITVFVLDPVESPEKRAVLSRAILAESRFAAEQVGFVIPPVSGAGNDLWRLEMMGGEFCGNAARSFGLYVAGKLGLKGKAEIFVSVSGANKPVHVEVDTEKSRASAEMPKPQSFETLDYKGRPLSALVFEGITHVIAPDIEPTAETFYVIKSLAETKLTVSGEGRWTKREAGTAPVFGAIGVLFYNTARAFLCPAVYVTATDSLVFESSCGSGSAALGAWLCRELRGGTARYAIAQPGGIIETEVIKKEGAIIRLTIGGEIKLGEPEEFTAPCK